MNKVFSVLNYKIFIDQEVLEILKRYKQTEITMPESGGILLGQIVQSSIFVKRISIPNRFDKSGRHYFYRDKHAAQLIVNYEFLNSDRRTIYLGEWHTHPEQHPKPSGTDRNMIKNQLHLGTLNEPFALLLIQGLQSIYLGIQVGENLTPAEEVSID